MIYVSKLKKVLCVAICATLVLLLAQPAIIEKESIFGEQASLATSTYYDTKWWALWTIRDKIKTSYYSGSTSYGTKSTVLCAKNSSVVSQNYGYSYTKALSGEVSLGASVPVKAIELEVGAKVSYSTSTTISASVTVPKKTTYYVYKRQDTSSKKYKSIVQNQWYYTDGTWKDSGSAKTVYSTVKQKYPTIIISK